MLPFAEQWVEKLKKEKKETSVEYGAALNIFGFALYRTRNIQDAEPILLQALDIRKTILGQSHIDVATSMRSLGLLYYNTGRFQKAESLFLDALEIRKKVLGEVHPDVAAMFSTLGDLYVDIGNYPKGEAFLLKASEIRISSLGEYHLDVANSLQGLGILYVELGNFSKAESTFLRALTIRKKILGENHIELAPTIINLGNLYLLIGDFFRAEILYSEAFKIYTEHGGDQLELTYPLLNLGIIYTTKGSYSKAETSYLQALEITEKVLGVNHPNVATCLFNIGAIYEDMGNYSKAKPYFLQAIEILKRTAGVNHKIVSGSFSRLACVHLAQGNMKQAELLFLDWNTQKQEQILRYFPFMSDQEKANFYSSNLSGYQNKFLSFCVERYFGNKTISCELYNDLLTGKGLLLNSSAKWKHRIKTSGDKKLFSLFTEWETSQNKLAKLLQSTDSTERAGIDSVEKKTEKMEKELSLRSENFARLVDKKQVTWKEVQKSLKPGEAAIEMVRVNKYGIQKTVTDNSDPKKPVYKIKGLTDTVYYAALIVKPESVYPEMVLLKSGIDMEGKHLKYYQNCISRQIPDNRSYGNFWEKIGARLGTSTRVYFSPDGVFHTINLSTLYNPKTKKYLLEEKDIRLVTVTKDLVNPSPAEEENKLAELVGFPSYYGAVASAGLPSPKGNSPVVSYGLRLESTETLSELPGTKEEVDKIGKVLETKGWEVKNYTRENALETHIKESYKPRVLHIATHGFFQPDSTKGSNPLLRSGLMLTGAGSSLKGEKNNEGEDGILTAYEAMNLNLDNTDLVVLSACETGLGEIKNGEGVYGLQRAFKVAGARSLIMSLWKVDDEATQELMVGFYKNWLGTASDQPNKGGKGLTPVLSKRAAFLKAQKELKAKYPNPYYWGAFVMVGE